MRAGKMKRRIIFQVSEDHRSPSGQVIHVWRDLATAWAEVKGISGRERMASGAIFSEATVRIWTRYRDDITTANRVLYRLPNIRGQVYSILAVIPDTDHTRLELLCKGGVFNA
nr:phage head closure protein [uncultured Serratia sp.]